MEGIKNTLTYSIMKYIYDHQSRSQTAYNKKSGQSLNVGYKIGHSPINDPYKFFQVIKEEIMERIISLYSRLPGQTKSKIFSEFW